MWLASGTNGHASSRSDRRRDAYIDSLRAAAIVRVFLQHTMPLGALTALLPSMWVMFGLAGYLTAASLHRNGGLRTIRSRTRRLLPPLWTLAMVAIPLMLMVGWPQFGWRDLLPWIFPVINPPSSEWGAPFATALWYLRAYLWLVLLSPLTRSAFQRWPVPTLITPLAGAVLFGTVLPLPTSPTADVLWSTAAYGPAWLLGYARHTGLLDRLAPTACLATAGTLGASALLRATTDPEGLHDPLAQALWGTAVVLLVLRARPPMDWLTRFPAMGRAIDLLNNRAVTIYVWQLPMIVAGLWLLDHTPGRSIAGPPLLTLLAGTMLTALAVLCFGWVEDLAGRRPPSLLPSRHTDCADLPSQLSPRQPSRKEGGQT
ncbi:acyltransferase [Catellatospora sp. NPDC049609]|uniref:acyltransferase family protein n=1 Tax=Catellatospora sp. NPDC049609 TaxID=3155505 RepID=UPI003430DC4A